MQCRSNHVLSTCQESLGSSTDKLLGCNPLKVDDEQGPVLQCLEAKVMLTFLVQDSPAATKAVEVKPEASAPKKKSGFLAGLVNVFEGSSKSNN